MKYSSFMDDLVWKDNARKVPRDQLDHPVSALWYLPHHPVLDPNKPDKIRVMFDCTAKHQGTSLNNQLLQGPDLTNNLIGILTHFEQEPVTLMASRCFTKSVPILMTMMPYSSAPHCHQAVQTSVFGELQRTISGNSGRKQLTASKTTSTSMTALSQSHRKIRPLYWRRSSVNYSLKEDFP